MPTTKQKAKNSRHAPRSSVKTSPASIEAKRRAEKALELRLEGATFAKIADEAGYNSPQAAYDAVRRAIAAITREPAEEVLRLDLERLDAMWGVHFLNAQAGDVQALSACMRIMERRAKLLGLDAPERKEVTGKDGSPLVPGTLAEMTDEQLAAIAAGGGAAAA